MVPKVRSGSSHMLVIITLANQEIGSETQVQKGYNCQHCVNDMAAASLLCGGVWWSTVKSAPSPTPFVWGMAKYTGHKVTHWDKMIHKVPLKGN